MNDETTRLINEEPIVNNQAAAPSVPSAKSAKKVNPVAAAAGGFVAGAATGVGATAFASAPTKEEEAELTVVAEEPEQQEPVVTPEPEQVILANDEGIRYAHVEADSFGEAYSQARQQVGAGGVFEYEGKIYSTYNYEEWHAMSAQERTEYQARVFENVPAPRPHAPATQASPQPAPTAVEPEPEPAHEAETITANAEMIDYEPVDNNIQVLTVEAVSTPEGQPMNIAVLENNGEQALLIDIDNDGVMEAFVYDANHDGVIQPDEVAPISEAGIQVDELSQMQVRHDGDMLQASDDGMPDYINDADGYMTV